MRYHISFAFSVHNHKNIETKALRQAQPTHAAKKIKIKISPTTHHLITKHFVLFLGQISILNYLQHRQRQKIQNKTPKKACTQSNKTCTCIYFEQKNKRQQTP